MAITFMLATAAVQANQCSNGGECPSADEPQNPVSLLQTKLRMNVLEDGPSIMKNPSAMLTELQGIARSGETPAFDLITTIKTLILDDIMPCLQTTRDAAAQATTDALSDIQSCNNKSKTREGYIENNAQKTVENARSLHAACREAEKALYDHNLTHVDSYCVKLGEFLHGADRLVIPDGSTRDYSVNYVKSASLTNMCSRTKATELDNGCTASEAELADKKAECSANQRSFELEFCTWKTELEQNCKGLGECHSTAVKAYWQHVNKTETLLEKWNVETAALQKILCYCNVWLSDMDARDNRSHHNVTQFDVCKDQTYTPDTVDHGNPADKAACPLTAVECHPGKDCFNEEYSSFADFVVTVVPCPAPTQATTAAPTTIAPTTTQATWNLCACEHHPTPHPTHPVCPETDVCQCIGEVRYGHGDTWSTSEPVNGSIDCSNAVFGDPLPTQGKECLCKQAR